MDPKGRIAVVTGAAGGIGGALVRALAGAEARVVIGTDLDIDRVEAVTNGVTSTSTVVAARRLDVGDDQATADLVEEIESEYGPIDLWFANAGVAGGGSVDAPDATWDLQWRVNLMAHVYAARALLPGWQARGEGHLITTASMAGILTSLGDGVYAATKHAAVGLAEWLAITYADQGIKISCVCPGVVNTPMARGGAGGDAGKASAMIGGGEVLEPDEAAARIVAAVAEDRFLIYTHPEMHEFVTRKAADPDRWIRGMSRLWARSRELLRD
jgi:NAD(P)-dependent dehydrogenase (short-subunit alcohol dehydrogenase family)